MPPKLSPDLPPGRYVKIDAPPMLDQEQLEVAPTARQEAVPGFSQSATRSSGVFFCGAGGLSAEQAPGVVRKGYARVAVTDMDFFEPTNYPRQLCYRDDLYQNKGICMARNLAKESVLGGEFVGLALPFLDAIDHLDLDDYQVGVCNVDNNEARVQFSDHFRRIAKPAIICGVSNDANSGYVFVQESRPGTACWACAFPHKVADIRHPCPGTPACKDILKVLGGFVLYAIDSLLMERRRNWNLRTVFLAGYLPDAARSVPVNPDCPLCGSRS